MKFAAYLGRTFLWSAAIGLGTGLGAASGVLIVLRADEALKEKGKKDCGIRSLMTEDELKATKVEDEK